MMAGKSNFGSEWHHVDSIDAPHIMHHQINLMNYGADTIDLIYCSHGIAYFDRDEIKDLFGCWSRALKHGGILRLSTPDWDVLRILPRPLIGPLYGKMNEPPIYHKTVYSYDELYQVLRAAGFINITRYNPCGVELTDQSNATYDGQLISLNVEAKKP